MWETKSKSKSMFGKKLYFIVEREIMKKIHKTIVVTGICTIKKRCCKTINFNKISSKSSLFFFLGNFKLGQNSLICEQELHLV